MSNRNSLIPLFFLLLCSFSFDEKIFVYSQSFYAESSTLKVRDAWRLVTLSSSFSLLTVFLSSAFLVALSAADKSGRVADSTTTRRRKDESGQSTHEMTQCRDSFPSVALFHRLLLPQIRDYPPFPAQPQLRLSIRRTNDHAKSALPPDSDPLPASTFPPDFFIQMTSAATPKIPLVAAAPPLPLSCSLAIRINKSKVTRSMFRYSFTIRKFPGQDSFH